MAKKIIDPENFLNTDTSMWSIFSNCLCVVEIFTTGLNPNKHDIIEICVLPVNGELKPHKGVIPFYTTVAPRESRKDNIDFSDLPYGVNKERIFDASVRGVEYYSVADRFDIWIQKLKLKHNKKIAPLAHDWLKKREFLIDWLGVETFDQYFDYRYRDLIPAATFANDCAEV